MYCNTPSKYDSSELAATNDNTMMTEGILW